MLWPLKQRSFIFYKYLWLGLFVCGQALRRAWWNVSFDAGADSDVRTQMCQQQSEPI